MEVDLFSLETLIQAMWNFLPRLGYALLILILARLLSSWGARKLRAALERRKRDEEIILLLELLTHWGILGLGIVLSMEQLLPGRLSALIAGLGIAGFTLGFALQDVAKNFIAGILLLLQQPFELGDGIEVAGYGGSVQRISLRATELRTWDGKYVIIPNADVYMSPVVNYSRAKDRRIELAVSVERGADLNRVAQVVLDAVGSLPGVKSEPAPQVVFQGFGDSALQFKLFFWIDTQAVGYGTAQDAAVKALQEAFMREGIELPYPTYRVHTLPA